MINDLTEITNFVIEAFLHTWPYLVLSIPLAVAVRVSNASRHIRKAFVGRPLIAILLATAVGAFSPFCSCGVIPIIASLLIAGVPLGPVMSFWIASPSMDPEIFLLSVSMLGWNLAVARIVATLILSISAGVLTHTLDSRGFFSAGILREQRKQPQQSWRQLARSTINRIVKPKPAPVMQTAAVSIRLDDIPVITTSAAGSTIAASCETDSCSTPVESSCSSSSCGGDSCETGSTELTFRQKLWDATVESTTMVVKFMFIAYVLEALILMYIPQESIVALLGAGNPFAIGASALVGVPIYTSNLTALPLVGGLLEQGMLPGAALAFLIAGATTTIPAMTAVYGITRQRVFAVYALSVLIGAVVAGYGYQALLSV
jgi:hypothetical protein